MSRSTTCIVMAYNEEATLAEATRDVVRGLSGFVDREYEVIIVDDGSTDRTPSIAAALADEMKHVRVITHRHNKGPGSAILTGFREAKMQNVCFHPADQQVPFTEIARCIPLLDRFDIVVGHRSDRPGYTFFRRLSSQTYISLVQWLFGLRQFNDFNFVYLYRKELLDQIAFETSGVFLCTEVLIKAVGLNAKTTTAEITCLPRQAGKATCGHPRVILFTCWQMLRFWLRHKRQEISKNA